MGVPSLQSTLEVWGYFPVKCGGGIHESSDSQMVTATFYEIEDYYSSTSKAHARVL